jgi:hypothetical protein
MTTAHTPTPDMRKHYAGMMRMHYAAADFYAKEFEKTANRKMLEQAAQALALAEKARALAKGDA